MKRLSSLVLSGLLVQVWLRGKRKKRWSEDRVSLLMWWLVVGGIFKGKGKVTKVGSGSRGDGVVWDGEGDWC